MLTQTKILILGAGGMLGTDLSIRLSPYDHLFLSDREDLDLTSSVAVAEKIETIKPDIIINTSGFTDVDGAEDNKELAFKLNSEAVKYIIAGAQRLQAKLIHFSTELVFSGNQEKGYNEQSSVSPLNVYGQSKVEGERYVTDYSQGYLIRTSWLYGHAKQKGKPRGLNFIDTILKLAAEKDEVKVVNDQYGKPTYTKDLAEVIWQLINQNYQPGTYHLVNEGVCSWYDLAQEALSIKKLSVKLIPISSSEYPTKAIRPQHAVLLNTKLPPLRPWREALQDYLRI